MHRSIIRKKFKSKLNLSDVIAAIMTIVGESLTCSSQTFVVMIWFFSSCNEQRTSSFVRFDMKNDKCTEDVEKD